MASSFGVNGEKDRKGNHFYSGSFILKPPDGKTTLNCQSAFICKMINVKHQCVSTSSHLFPPVTFIFRPDKHIFPTRFPLHRKLLFFCADCSLVASCRATITCRTDQWPFSREHERGGHVFCPTNSVDVVLVARRKSDDNAGSSLASDPKSETDNLLAASRSPVKRKLCSP